MGIGITSNGVSVRAAADILGVSIPNGDRHYLELLQDAGILQKTCVSIPNGDRHYLEQFADGVTLLDIIVSIPNGDRHYLEPSPHESKTTGDYWRFQSPMGIGITSNLAAASGKLSHTTSFNPQWG